MKIFKAKPNPMNPLEDLKIRIGEGKNTWEFKFHGKSEDGKIICFIYQFNFLFVSSGIKPVTMLDVIVSIIDEEEKLYKFDERFVEIKKKKIAYNELSILGDYSKIYGDYDNIHIETILPYTLEMDIHNVGGMFQFDQKGFLNIRDNDVYGYFLPEMAAEGHVVINNVNYEIAGDVWFNRTYNGFPSFKSKHNDSGLLKLELLFDNSGERIWLCASRNIRSGDTQCRMVVCDKESEEAYYSPDNACKLEYECWESDVTGIKYPTSLIISDDTQYLHIEIEPTFKEQEFYSQNKKVGYYLGVGYFTGRYRNKQVSGYCFYDISGKW